MSISSPGPDLAPPVTNTFTEGPLGSLFAKTALPLIFVMSMNGLLAVVDAIFLGLFVGPEALGAVTLMFPAYMLVVALSTLVSSGMSSILARKLGGRKFDEARAVFASAHGIALLISLVFVGLFLAFGRDLTHLTAGGSATLGQMGYTYLRISIFFSPVLFVLALQTDALRNEGRAGLMAAMSLIVSVANIGFNYILIALLDMGVAGSAYGTVLAQSMALVAVLVFRLRWHTELRPNVFNRRFFDWRGRETGWSAILALGAPQSLNFLGVSLTSAAIIFSLQIVQSGTYAATVSAYGIVTRIMTFVFLPLLGLSFALQSITGNNYGARRWARSDAGLRLGMSLALIYCASIELMLIVFPSEIALFFVTEPAVVNEVTRIMPVMVAMFFIGGPVMMIAAYFQAIGDAGRAAVLGLAKTYGFAIPLTFLLPTLLGEPGIWLAGPLAELLLLGVAMLVLAGTARRYGMAWGLFKAKS